MFLACPHLLANHLLTLLGDHSMDILLQHVFLRCLPTYAQDAPANADITDLETLRDRADAIMSRPRCPDPQVCNVSAPDDPEDDMHSDDPPAPVNRLSRRDGCRQRPPGRSGSAITAAFIHPVLLPPALWPHYPLLPTALHMDLGKPAPSPQAAMSLQGADCTIL